MKKEDREFDICVITMSRLQNDARSLNLARILAKNNLKVAVIGIGSDEDKEYFIREKITFFHKKLPQKSRTLIKWVLFILSLIKFRKKASAKIYVSSDLYSLPIGIRLKNKYKSKLIYDSRDIYSALGPLYQQPFKQIVIASIEKYLIKKVDEIIVSGEADRDYLKNYFKHNIPYHVILNLPPYKPISKSNIIRDKYKIPENYIILVYQGMILPGRGLVPAINALPFINNAILCIIGEGNYRTYLENLANSLNVSDRVIFCGIMNYDDLHQWTSSADIGLSLIEKISKSTELALPNKLFEYCRAGIPTIATNLPAMKEYCAKYKIGKCVDPSISPKELAAEILKIIDKENYKEFSSACHNASKELCYETQEDTILRIFGKEGAWRPFIYGASDNRYTV